MNREREKERETDRQTDRQIDRWYYDTSSGPMRRMLTEVHILSVTVDVYPTE